MKHNKKKVTIHDIAREANVSASTVSRAFDIANKHRISEKTRKHIYKIAEKYGYQPNKIARALSKGGTDTIALVFTDAEESSESEYYARVIMRAVAALRNHNYDLKIHTLRDEDPHCGFSELLAKFTVDGLIITGISNRMNFGDSNVNETYPVVVLNGYDIQSAIRIDADNIEGGRLAADHFIKLNHVKIGMLKGPRDCRDALDREQGFCSQLTKAGLKLRKSWFVSCEYSEQSGHEAAINILKKADKPTALFCANDEIALGALRAIRECNLKCPEDISLIGFDNFSAAHHTTPPLTTVEQPIKMMVNEAVDHLMKLLNNNGTSKRVVFPVELVKRESVFKL